MDTQTITLTLADQFAVARQKHAEAHSEARREYDTILARGAVP